MPWAGQSGDARQFFRRRTALSEEETRQPRHGPCSRGPLGGRDTANAHVITSYSIHYTKLYELYPVLVFGGAQALIHFYPNLSENNKRQLFKYGIFTISGIGIGVLIVLILGQFIIDWNRYQYLFFAFPLAVALAFIELFKRQAANLQKIAVPTFYEKIIPKVALPAVFVLVLLGLVTENIGIYAFIAFYFLLLLLLSQYLFRFFSIKGEGSFQELFNEISKSVITSYSIHYTKLYEISSVIFKLTKQRNHKTIYSEG